MEIKLKIHATRTPDKTPIMEELHRRISDDKPHNRIMKFDKN